MRVMIVRHGDPDYSIDSLTEAGWKEAKALARLMEKKYGQAYKEGKVTFFCSPLGRARDTAGETLKQLGAKAEILPWLTEFTEVRITDPRTGTPRITWDLYPKDWIDQEEHYQRDNWWRSPLMSSGDDVKKAYDRVVNGLDGILADHGYVREGDFYRAVKSNHNLIVLFCHMGVASVLMSHLLNCPPSITWQSTFLAPSSRTIFDMEERDEGIAVFRMRCMGDVSHLNMENLPISDSGMYGEVYPEPKRGKTQPNKEKSTK